MITSKNVIEIPTELNRGIPYKNIIKYVQTGLNYVVTLSENSLVHSCGKNNLGQLGLGDKIVFFN